MAGIGQRLAATPWIEMPGDGLRHAGAIVSLGCETMQILDVGSHAVLICQAGTIFTSCARGALLYFGWAYHEFELGK